MANSVKLIKGDFTEVLPKLESNSVDLVLVDPPYFNKSTLCTWDTPFDIDQMWSEVMRVFKKDNGGAIIIFGMNPFSARIILGNVSWYKYNLVWKKTQSGFMNAKNRPLNAHEDIIVFSDGKIKAKNRINDTNSNVRMKYNPEADLILINIKKDNVDRLKDKSVYGNKKFTDSYTQTHTNYPTTILSYKQDKLKLHPTQKPIALLEKLIEYYSNPNDVVLDFCMGSASTGVAALNKGRSFIGIEKTSHFYNVSKKRMLDLAERNKTKSLW